MIDPAAFIHPKAHVDGTVTVGAGTKVWQFASVIRGTVLGRECVVASTATLDGAIFGDRCIVSPGVDMGPGFVIGDDVFIGPHVVLCNDAWPRVDKTGFDYAGLRDGRIVCVRIGRAASVGANAVVLPGVRIGAGAMVASGAVVIRDVPDGCLLTRDGRIKPIDETKVQRMRVAC